MIHVTKEQKDQTLVLKITGAIEETVNLNQLLGPPSKEMEIYCQGISRINSIGVKSWIQYFQECQLSGSQLKFFECSTAIVEQINLISNFVCHGSVESIYVPFSCSICKNEFIGLFKTEDLKILHMDLPQLQCTKCTGVALFDDIAEEYFGFLNR